MFIATLIAAERLARGDIIAAADALSDAGLVAGAPEWIEAERACDLPFAGEPGAARSALECRFQGVDVVVQSRAGRRRRLLAADMDKTMVAAECLDELADMAGIGPEIAAVTERAMAGEIGFEEALRTRIGLLKGTEANLVDRCREQRIHPMPGARTLVRTMRAQGAFTLLVSGGFTLFAEPIAEFLGFEAVAANRLGLSGGRLDGSVSSPILGAEGKKQALVAAAAERAIALSETLAVGDGANDVPMLRAAGLGVALGSRDAVAQAADARIAANDLTALLYAQAIPRKEWISG